MHTAPSSRRITIAGRPIAPTEPPYVIAEMSGNHNGDIERAFQILEAARDAGADAVKIQTYRPDTITIDHDGPEFMIHGGLWDGRRLYDLYEEAHTPWEWHEALFECAKDLGITLFSSPFDPTAVDLLEDLGTPAYKIASPELVDLPLIRYVAATAKPLIMSTGMATLVEIQDAVAAARDAGATDIALLHCTSAYPAPLDDANLSTIPDLAERTDVVVGLSDHTLGTTTAAAAVALGATIIEKHFTLSRADGGVDSAFSLEPDELRTLVHEVCAIHGAVGTPTYGPAESEADVLKHRRSLYVVSDVRAGERFTPDNVRSIRPANGLAPKLLDQVLGRTATRDIAYGEPLDWSMVDGTRGV